MHRVSIKNFLLIVLLINNEQIYEMQISFSPILDTEVKWEEKRGQGIRGNLFFRHINFVFYIPACSKEIGETLCHCEPKKES